MAEIFNFYVQDNRTIQFPKNNLLEPIMQEDHNVAVWRFRIPKVLNAIDMSGYAWWFVYVNAKGREFSELLTLVDDIDEPDSFCTADYSIDYGISYHPGNFQFSLEAINADSGGEVLNEWHTKTYAHKVDKTLQGNQAQWSETESDIISALIIEVQNKVSQLVGGATPEPKNLVADMTDPKKVYLYVGNEEDESNGYWYYHNGTRFVPGGLYASGVTVDSTPTQGSAHAVSSGGVYDALQSAGLSEDVKTALLNCFKHVAWIDGHGQNYYDALESALYPETGLVRIEATFTQGSAMVYPTTPLNDLKAFLTVTGYYNNGTSRNITDYALSGTLTTGTNTVTVYKDGKTATFNVTVSQPYWDYEWYASSGALPEGMTADAYDFSTVPGALHVEKPVMDFDYIGDIRLYIECSLYSANSTTGTEQNQSNPQIVIKNKVVSENQYKGCKVIASPPQTSTLYVGFGVNGTTAIIQGIASKDIHAYDISAINGVYSLTIDGTEISITQNDNTTPYINFTGISSSNGLPENVTQIMDIKCIKYKKL